VTSGIGLLANTQINPVLQWPKSSVRSKMFILWTIESREALLSLDEAMRESFDPYLFLRDAYLQNRQYLIFDGNPPEPDFEISFDADFDADFEAAPEEEFEAEFE